MPNMTRSLKLAVLPAIALSALVFVGHRTIVAADHNEPAARTQVGIDPTPDRAADLADIFAFHDDDSLVAILTFAGPQATNLPAVYDPDVLYRLNISNDSVRTDAEIVIEMRFGLDGENAGIEVRGLPGSGPIQGPVETTIRQNGYVIRAGLFDDPFFFDLQGFRDTLASGNLMFRTDRDAFGSQNITAIVLEIPRDRIENGDNLIDISSDTGRFGGQL